jgi:hypothetical protein
VLAPDVRAGEVAAIRDITGLQGGGQRAYRWSRVLHRNAEPLTQPLKFLVAQPFQPGRAKDRGGGFLVPGADLRSASAAATASWKVYLRSMMALLWTITEWPM